MIEKTSSYSPTEVAVKRLSEYCYRIVSRRDYSEGEIRRKLVIRIRRINSFRSEEKRIDEVVVNEIITKLKEQGFIDDGRFAKNWIESRRRSKLKGDLAIKQELLAKGISDEVVKAVFSESEEVDELEQAVVLLERKLNKLDLTDEKLKKKAYGILLRSGYSFEVVAEAVERLSKKEYNLEE